MVPGEGHDFLIKEGSRFLTALKVKGEGEIEKKRGVAYAKMVGKTLRKKKGLP